MVDNQATMLPRRNLRLQYASFDVEKAKKSLQDYEMDEIKLICGVIGFLFIGAMLGIVIGLNAPPIDEEKKNDEF